uniref:Uncharacterized protein n=1 Tax=Oryza meridionalis TaxID=40149 RepID=A0A0E0E3Q6_9ORYZ
MHISKANCIFASNIKRQLTLRIRPKVEGWGCFFCTVGTARQVKGENKFTDSTALELLGGARTLTKGDEGRRKGSFTDTSEVR